MPAYFNSDQRYATKLAAQLAGIACERIINEPSAAALTAWEKEKFGKNKEELTLKNEEEETTNQYMLVFDFGGGTLDVSIVDCLPVYHCNRLLFCQCLLTAPALEYKRHLLLPAKSFPVKLILCTK